MKRINHPYTKKEIQFIHDHYLGCTYAELANLFESEFGYRRCGKALRRKAYNDGLRKQLFGINESWVKKGQTRNKIEMRISRTMNSKNISLVEALAQGA